MLGTTVLIPTSLVPQMGGGNVRLLTRTVSQTSFDTWFHFFFFPAILGFLIQLSILHWPNFLTNCWPSQEEKAKVIQTILFVAGLNTLAQTFFGTRLPAVIGGSYTFVPTTVSIVLAGRYNSILDPVEVAWWIPPTSITACLSYLCKFDPFPVMMLQKFEKIMRGTQGALIVASILQIVVGFSGLWRNVVR